jgi:hypothetical protein
LHGDGEEDEAHLSVPSERRGMQWSGGAMERRWRFCEVVLLCFAHREKRKVRGEEGSGGA